MTNLPSDTSIHYRTCHLCEAMCGLEITTQGDQVLSIRGDQLDVYSKGHICPKAVALQDMHTDPDRLRQPIRRKPNGEWEPISWETAFEEVTRQITRLQRAYGRDAIGIYTGNPTVHNTGTILYLYDFMNAVGTRNRFASHSLDQLPLMYVCGELYGHQAMFPVPDLERTHFFLILGANPLVSNGGIMSTPDIAGKLKAIQARGGKVAVIDPRRTLTAGAADEYLPIRPGTDVLLLLAMVNTLFAENLVRSGHVGDFTDGLESLRSLSAPYTPERVEGPTGVPAADIRRLTREFSAAEGAVCYGRMGVSTQAFGGLCQWLIQCINILTGNLDRPGGAMFTRPAVDFLSLLRHEAKMLRWNSRVRGLPEVAGDLPAAAMAEEMLTAGEGQVRGLITVAGNPVLSAPNGPLLEKAMEGLEFMVSVDLYLNETTRHAHIILPPAAGLEVMHYDFVLAIVAIRNMANFSAPVLPKGAGALYDWEILYELQKRVEKVKNGPVARAKHLLFDQLTPERRIDLGLRLGPYGVWGGRFLRKDGLSLKKLKALPHGIDLGPLQPCLPGRLFTRNKRINLTPGNITKDLPRVETLFQPASGNHLSLIGRRHLNTNNSWMHNYPRLMKKGADICTALIHPRDAKKYGISHGDQVRLRSGAGEITLQATVDPAMTPGTVSIPHGWGHGYEGTKLGVANTHPGVNVNRLVDHRIVDELTGAAVFNGVPVWIEKA